MSLHERVARLEDRERLRELRYEYGYRLDDRDWEGWTELFTEDVVCDYEGWGTVQGRDELLRFAEERIAEAFEYTAHVMHHPVIDIAPDGRTGTGRWYVEVYDARTDGTARWRQGRYRDEYRLVDGDWRFSAVSHDFFARRISPGFAVDETEYHGEIVTFEPGRTDDRA